MGKRVRIIIQAEISVHLLQRNLDNYLMIFLEEIIELYLH